MTIDKLIDLREELILRGVKGQQVETCIETFLQSLDEYKSKYGSAKHLVGDAYYKAMSDRNEFAYQQAIKILEG